MVVAATMLLLATAAYGQTNRFWAVGSGNWGVDSNWTPIGVPTDNDTVQVDDIVSTFTVTYDYTGPAVSLGSLTVTAESKVPNDHPTGMLSMAANNLTVSGTESIGNSGSATVAGMGSVSQSGGDNNAGGLVLGASAKDNGSYNLSGTGVLTVTGVESIGTSGSGSFNQTGGANSAANEAIGQEVYLSFSTGSYSQSGGTNTVTNSLVISSYIGATYTLSDGSLNAASVQVGTSQFIGGGIGGGGMTVFLPGNLTISGTGTLTTSNLSMQTGEDMLSKMSSSVNLSGGTINFTNPAQDIAVITWNSGAINFLTSVTWDPNDSTSPAASIGSALTLGSSQTLGVTGNETLGGTGTFALTVGSGGTHTVSGTVTVNSGSKLNLSGGILNVGGLNLGGTTSRFSWNSGTLNITNNVVWDSGAGSTGTGSIFGSALTIGTNKTLMVTGNETLSLPKAGSAFALTINTGGTHAVSKTLAIDPLGSLTVDGGTLNAGSLSNVGSLTIKAAAASVGNATLFSGSTLDIVLSEKSGPLGEIITHGELDASGSLTLGGALDVTLSGFTPTLGNSFDILDWGTLSGAFSSISLPALSSGLAWSKLRLYSTGELLVVSSTVLPGDFNRDGHVDAADILPMEQALASLSGYQMAHNTLSTAQLLAIEDVNGDGQVNNADLQALLNDLNSGGGSAGSVPEPDSIALLSFGALAIAFRLRSRKAAFN
jgi:hypothetical protein